MFYFFAAVAIYGRNGNKLMKNAFDFFGNSEGGNSKIDILIQTIQHSTGLFNKKTSTIPFLKK